MAVVVKRCRSKDNENSGSVLPICRKTGDQFLPELRLNALGGKGMVRGFQVTPQKMGFFPSENPVKGSVFFRQGNVGNGSRIGIDAHGDPGAVEAIGRVIGYFVIDIGLDITGRANLKMNILFAEESHQFRVFCAPDAMTYTTGMKMVERFPDAVGAAGLSGVGGARDPVLMCVPEGRYMVINGEARFVGGDIETNDMRTSKMFDQPYGFHTLF